MPKKEEALEVEGVVTQALANTRFRVQLDDGPEVMAHVAGKMRKHFIRIVPGDRVRVEFDEPVRAVAPGQAAVFYDLESENDAHGQMVVGGGWLSGQGPS